MKKINVEAISKEERWNSEIGRMDVLVKWEGYDEMEWNGKDDLMRQIGETKFNELRKNSRE